MVTGVNLPDGFVALGGSELKESLNSKTDANYRMDAGLLILRCAGLFLALTFGRQKVGWLIELIRSHHTLSSWDFARFLQGLGFPAPSLLAICAVVNESVTALFISVGFLTRLSASCAALGMAVAFYVSMRLHEDALRAFLYCAMFAALAITGPGRFSTDYLLKSRTAGSKPAIPS
jgi:putative oxidoreductase